MGKARYFINEDISLYMYGLNFTYKRAVIHNTYYAALFASSCRVSELTAE